MRVVIEQRKEKRGAIFSELLYAFYLWVEFTEEERQMIIDQNLMQYTIHQRPNSVDDHGRDEGYSNLTIHSIIRMGVDPNVYLCERAVDAANAETGAKEGLEGLAKYFDEVREAEKLLRGQ